MVSLTLHTSAWKLRSALHAARREAGTEGPALDICFLQRWPLRSFGPCTCAFLWMPTASSHALHRQPPRTTFVLSAPPPPSPLPRTSQHVQRQHRAVQCSRRLRRGSDHPAAAASAPTGLTTAAARAAPNIAPAAAVAAVPAIRIALVAAACAAFLPAAWPGSAAAAGAAVAPPAAAGAAAAAAPVAIAGPGGVLVGVGVCVIAVAFSVLVFFAVPTLLVRQLESLDFLRS